MDIKTTLEKSINRQIQMELASFYAYLGMEAWFEEKALSGFAHWMRLQSSEEHEHAMKFFTYLHDRGGSVTLFGLDKPKMDFASPLEVFQASLAQERAVSASIYEIYEEAHDQKDFATVSFLKWFLDEQVEEERSTSDMVQRLEFAGDSPEAIFLLDKEAGQRGGGGS